MNYELTFFDYKENCKEFKTLLKATSENATRKELVEGQNLFDSIFKNIVIISSKLYDIRKAISKLDIEITGSDEMENITPHNFVLTYNNNSSLSPIEEEHFYYSPQDDYYYTYILTQINDIRKFLDSNFDHSEFIRRRSEIEAELKLKNKGDGRLLMESRSYNVNINSSIENVLKYYSTLSGDLKKYLKLFKSTHSFNTRQL